MRNTGIILIPVSILVLTPDGIRNSKLGLDANTDEEEYRDGYLDVLDISYMYDDEVEGTVIGLKSSDRSILVMEDADDIVNAIRESIKE